MYLVKERKADMYRLSVYYVCSTLCDMVAHILYPTFFMCIVYFMAGFKRTVQCFFLTLAATLLIAITSQVKSNFFRELKTLYSIVLENMNVSCCYRELENCLELQL